MMELSTYGNVSVGKKRQRGVSWSETADNDMAVLTGEGMLAHGDVSVGKRRKSWVSWSGVRTADNDHVAVLTGEE